MAQIECNDNITCPHCDYEDKNSEEQIKDNGFTHKTYCGNCGKDFYFSCDMSFTFNSDKKEF